MIGFVPASDAAAVLRDRPPGRPPGRLRRAAEAVLASYSQVLFARKPVVGVLVLAATFVVPSVGAVGLLGVLLASGLALALGLDREAVRSGVLGYNALLVFLLAGALLDRSPAFWGLAAVLALAVVLVHVALSGAMRYHLRLPTLSLPFVVVGWLALLAVPYVRGMALVPKAPALALAPLPGPELIDTFLRSLGAIFFQPHWTAGALVLLALLLWSRIAVVHALVGFAVAVLADRYVFSFPPDFVHLYVGFNFIMTAVALGGIYYVPGPASMLLAAGGSLTCGLASVGLINLLQPVGLPVLALPFNLTVLVVLYALGQRTLEARPRPVDFLAGSPEDNLNHFRTRVLRFRTGLAVRLQLPVRGSWVVTQGHDGEHTHQGPWRHGLDLEVADRDGSRHRGAGEELTDWLCYRLPVIAPAAGTVVRVIDGLPDMPIGAMDPASNWGNVVVLQHALGVFSLLAHLSPGSIGVVEGQVVAAGAVLGKVGSSGRAPVPHLHVQLQASPTVGDPTIPIELHDVVLEGDAGAVLEACRVPLQGDRLRNLTRDAEIGAMLDLPVGGRVRVAVTCDGVTSEEELVSDVDLLGARSLWSPDRDARLWFAASGASFVAFDHVGPRDGALFALYVALARVPLDGADLTWTDHLNPRRLGSSPLAWLRDGLAAVLPPAEQPIGYRAQSRSDTLVITGSASPQRPWQRAVRTRATLRRGRGLEQVRVSIGDHTITVTPLEHGR